MNELLGIYVMDLSKLLKIMRLSNMFCMLFLECSSSTEFHGSLSHFL